MNRDRIGDGAPMSALHTPGTWKVVGPLDAIFATDPYGHGDMRIADVRGWGHLTGDGGCRLKHEPAVAIQQANARLIAAAPDLLAACKRVVEHYGDPANGELFGLRAAIAKATGATRGCEQAWMPLPAPPKVKA